MNKLLVVLSTVLLVLVIGMIGHAQNADVVNQARRAFYDGDYEESAQLWTQVQEMEEYEWEGSFFLGLIYFRTGDLEQAADNMYTAYTLRPEHYQTLVNYARILYHKDALNDAKDILRQVPENDRKVDPQYYNLRGLLSIVENDYLTATELLAVAAELDPENYYVQNNLGLALINSGEYEVARDHLLKAVAQDPQQSYIYNNLGVAYENLNQLEEAEASYKKALVLDEENIRAEMNLERVQDALGANN